MRKASRLNGAASQPRDQQAGGTGAPGLWPKNNTDAHDAQQVTRWSLCSLLPGSCGREALTP